MLGRLWLPLKFFMKSRNFSFCLTTRQTFHNSYIKKQTLQCISALECDEHTFIEQTSNNSGVAHRSAKRTLADLSATF